MKKTILFPMILVISFFTGCKKDFLDKKNNTNIVVPTTLTDMTQLLDNMNDMSSPAIDVISSDEYIYPSLEAYNSFTTLTEKNSYIWNKDIYQGQKPINDWNMPYKKVFTSNVVLAEWNKLSNEEKNSVQGKYVKAWAMFSRSIAFYSLVQLFAPAYDKNTAGSDLGIPLKISADANNTKQRASVQNTYDFIIADLESSLVLFSNDFPTLNRNRPSKAAVYALLSRIYLSMGDYENAKKNAIRSLTVYDKLLDYNSVSQTASTPFDIYNSEIILYEAAISDYYAAIMGSGPTAVDPNLVSLYESKDLRKTIFFNQIESNFFIKRGYGFFYTPFKGLAVDEIYLIKAECQARADDLNGALLTMNLLLEKRYQTGSFVAFTSGSKTEILNKILTERRKELVWRGLRWFDLKRLNKEGANITISRVLNGQTYTLPPNDPRYVMPIPDDEIALSHIQQNIR